MNNSLRGRDYINIHDLSSEDFRYLLIALIVEPQQNQRTFQFAELAYELIEFFQLFPFRFLRK